MNCNTVTTVTKCQLSPGKCQLFQEWYPHEKRLKKVGLKFVDRKAGVVFLSCQSEREKLARQLEKFYCPVGETEKHIFKPFKNTSIMAIKVRTKEQLINVGKYADTIDGITVAQKEVNTFG